MKIIGQILLWAGFLSGSLATVYNLPAKGIEKIQKMTVEEAEKARFELPDVSELEVQEDGWHLIPWTWYIASASICGLGVVIMTVQRLSEGGKNEATEANLKEIKAALEDLIIDVGRLEKETEKWAPSEITAYIDNTLAKNFMIFADGRDSITAEHGLEVFAEVMTQFAAGERSLNRAWSAAADGYIDEVVSCVERGKNCLKAAKEELRLAAEAKN